MKTLAIILGINGDLGSAITTVLLKEHDFTILGVDQQTVSKHQKITYFPCDLAEKEQIFSTLNTIKFSDYQRIIFISTVGLFGEPTFTDDGFNEKDFCKSVEVNLLGVCNFISGSIARCLKDKVPEIRVVIVGSTAAQVGSLNLGYGVAKAGLNGFVRSISKSLAARGVVCIGVNPGIFESSMSKSVSKDRQNRAIGATHIKRIGGLDEVSKFVVQIAVEAPAYLTGSIIPLNGGQYS